MATRSALAGSWVLSLGVCVAVSLAWTSPAGSSEQAASEQAHARVGHREVLLSALLGGLVGALTALAAVAVLRRVTSRTRPRASEGLDGDGRRHRGVACQSAVCGLEDLAREVEERLDRKIDRLQRLVEAADEYFGGGRSLSSGGALESGKARSRRRSRDGGREAPIVAAPWKQDATGGRRSGELAPSERRRTEVSGAASPHGVGRDEAGVGDAASGRGRDTEGEGESRVGAVEITQEERDLVLSLAAGGKSPETISDTVGLRRGEVDLILRLYGRSVP